MDNDDEELCKFGTPLPVLNEEEIPSKKPFDITEQIAVDSNGRRRFHGAFTGGFSAGYWNTVGSQKGWQPKSFKSSRLEKAEQTEQKPTDFMDDEDTGEFGIAAERIQTTDDFTPQNRRNKRKLLSANSTTTPIPGIPVLFNYFEQSVKDKIAVRLLKQMGWREHQGIGARLTQNEKRKANKRRANEGVKFYNCDMGPLQKEASNDDIMSQSNDSEDNSDDEDDIEITFAPDDFEPFVADFKSNRFGLGYVSLNQSNIYKKHVGLFEPFEVLDRNNKKLSISGQAFGVGAFEEDDEDVYNRDNFEQYDFSMGDEKKDKMKKKPSTSSVNFEIISGFSMLNMQNKLHKKVFVINKPDSFTPRNWLKRKTRFGPAITNEDVVTPSTSTGIDDNRNRSSRLGSGNILTPITRGALLNETVDPSTQKQIEFETNKSTLDDKHEEISGTNNQMNIKSEQDDLHQNKLSLSVDNLTKTTNNDKIIPKTNRNLLTDLFADRFVSEKDLVKNEPKVSTEELKKVIKVVRTTSVWTPSSLLYKLMNIEEPNSRIEPEKSTKSFSLFECLSLPTLNQRQINTSKRPPEFITSKLSDVNDLDEIPNKISSNTTTTVVSVDDSSKLKSSTKDHQKEQLISNNEKSTIVTENIMKQLTSDNSKKTELELKIINAQDKHPSEKRDIYKAIFEDSDDDDAVDEVNVSQKLDTSVPSSTAITTVTATIVPADKTKLPFQLNTVDDNAAAINILRNTSPPRGIFTNLLKMNSSISDKIINEKDETNEMAQKNSDPELDNAYGPKLPEKIISDNQTMPIIYPKESSKTKHNEIWVEKCSSHHHKTHKSNKKLRKHKDKRKKSKKKHKSSKK